VILMNIQIRVAVTAAVLTLAGCGGSSEPAAPVAAPTEVAAVKTPPPVYPIELACQAIGGTTTLKVVVGTEGKPGHVQLVSGSGNA